jgi:two-component system response regulator
LKEKKILIVEDDPDHADLILDIFDTEDVKGEVVLMRDGQEVIDYLQETDSSASQTTSLNGLAGQAPLGSTEDVQPIIADSNIRHSQIDLIILDLNLPKINGMDVLKSLKENSKYSSIPVVILSTSSDQNTISEAYKNGANGYITKPMSYDEFVDKVKMLRRYLSDTNTLPPQA